MCPRLSHAALLRKVHLEATNSRSLVPKTNRSVSMHHKHRSRKPSFSQSAQYTDWSEHRGRSRHTSRGLVHFFLTCLPPQVSCAVKRPLKKETPGYFEVRPRPCSKAVRTSVRAPACGPEETGTSGEETIFPLVQQGRRLSLPTTQSLTPPPPIPPTVPETQRKVYNYNASIPTIASSTLSAKVPRKQQCTALLN